MATQTQREKDRQKLRTEKPDVWISVHPGDTIHGRIVDVTEAWSDQRQGGSFYPLLTIDADQATGYDEPGELKVHAFGAVLYNEVMRHRPEIGETVLIEYKGTSDRTPPPGQSPPELYRLRVEGRTDGAARAYDRIEPPQARQPQNGPQPDEDIPF